MSRCCRPPASRWRPCGRWWRRGWRSDRALLEEPPRRRLHSMGVVPIKSRRGEDKRMITKLNATSIMVLDKDEALDFYVNKVGLEKGQDIKQGSYRWLTVRVPDDPGTEISLEEPGPPLHDEATAAQLRELITKGAMGGLVFQSD